MKKSKYKVPLYRGNLVVIQTKNLNKVENKYNLECTSGMSGLTFVNYDKDDYPTYIVAFEGKTTPSIIAHEALHIVCDIYRDIHAEIDLHNQEPQCYLLDWIVETIHKTVKTKKG